MPQTRIIIRLESIEFLCIDFRGTVAPHQVSFEVDTDFRHHGRTVRMFGRSNLDGGNQVFFAVCPQHTHWKL